MNNIRHVLVRGITILMSLLLLLFMIVRVRESNIELMLQSDQIEGFFNPTMFFVFVIGSIFIFSYIGFFVDFVKSKLYKSKTCIILGCSIFVLPLFIMFFLSTTGNAILGGLFLGGIFIYPYRSPHPRFAAIRDGISNNKDKKGDNL